MEQIIAENLAKKLGIDILQIVREYYEILILRGISLLKWGKDLIFKGGTAMRLVYGSPRFSEDLDFSITKSSIKKNFEKDIMRLMSPFYECKIDDIMEKHFTYLAEIKVKKEFLPHPFRIKIEISKRIEENYQWELKVASSPSSIYSVLLKVSTLHQLYKDKIGCLRDRAKPKDLFDLWYISQKLNIPYKTPVSLEKKILKRDLKKYLPLNFHPIIEKL